MCGIAGILGDGDHIRQLERMNYAQRHRGPDGMGVSQVGRCGLGNTRLAIIDLGSRGHQPIIDLASSNMVTYNGEIYNFRELKAQLPDYRFLSDTDTEVILAAYERWGTDCVDHFVGQFAFGLWDNARQTLFLARDRLGIKPLYYTWHKGAFYFASEIKALLAAGVPALPDEDAWADYLVHGLYDHGARTFFKGIRSFPAGWWAGIGPTATDRFTYIAPYWLLDRNSPWFRYRLHGVDDLNWSDDEAAEQLLSLLQDSVRLCLTSDVPVGLNLSSGLDSNVLMSLMPGEIVSHCMGEGTENESAGWLMPSEVESLLPQVMWHQEAPFGGLATVTYHKHHAYIKEGGYKVVLEGQGADETLAGYDYYQSDQESNVYQDGTSHLRPECISGDMKIKAGKAPTFPKLGGTDLNDALYRDLRYTKLPRVLRMNDHLSMAHGVELREPYLDHRLVEFCFSLPDEMKVRDGIGKWLLRHAVRGKVPDGIRLAPKVGDTTPQRAWLRGPLRPMVKEILNSQVFKELGWFDVVQCQKEYERFCQDGGANSFWIWQWVNAYLWHQTFMGRTAINEG